MQDCIQVLLIYRCLALGLGRLLLLAVLAAPLAAALLLPPAAALLAAAAGDGRARRRRLGAAGLLVTAALLLAALVLLILYSGKGGGRGQRRAASAPGCWAAPRALPACPTHRGSEQSERIEGGPRRCLLLLLAAGLLLLGRLWLRHGQLLGQQLLVGAPSHGGSYASAIGRRLKLCLAAAAAAALRPAFSCSGG